MIRKIALMLAASIALLSLTSWGNRGHTMISFRINLSFNEEMDHFSDWVFYLTEHASDADKRKRDDPEEGPKHYIDIDNYDMFTDQGRIPTTLDSCIAVYGEQFVEDNGYLPWATLAMYDSVVSCLERGDWTNAKKYGADLGHYVADGHMPMHLTRNYDGQFSDNKGIHARYEIEMIDRYHDQVSYSGTPAAEVSNVTQYIFNYIYSNYAYMDSILIADDYAREMTGGTSSELYYTALWERTEHLTNQLFGKASHALAELLYSAWIDAGRPQAVGDVTGNSQFEQLPGRIKISPNPVKQGEPLHFQLPFSGDFFATVYDTYGRKTDIMTALSAELENHSFAIHSNGLSAGSYFIVLENCYSRMSESFMVSP
jgi:hypothetical protein